MRTGVLFLAGGLILTACQPKDSSSANDTASSAMAGSQAMGPITDGAVTTVVRDASNRELGTLTISESSGGLSIDGTLMGLPPGERAVHLHTVGLCEAPFTSAGAHWNPLGRHHGKDNPEGQHLGDLLNITVASDSTVVVAVRSEGATLTGENGLLDADGAAVVVHAKADDYKTDPAGNAGDRIACGVIRGS